MRIDLSQNSVMLSVNPERAAATLRAFAARGIGEPRIVEGWRVMHTPHKAYPLSYAGNALNMMEIIMHAKRSALPYCVVYEDDAFPRINAQQTLDAILAENPLPEDCGLLSLGDWNGNLGSRIRRTLPLSHCGTPYTRTISRHRPRTPASTRRQCCARQGIACEPRKAPYVAAVTDGAGRQLPRGWSRVPIIALCCGERAHLRQECREC